MADAAPQEETKAPFRINSDAIGYQKVTRSQAKAHCVTTWDIKDPTENDIDKAEKQLEKIRCKVNALACVEIRSLFVIIAKSKGVMNPGTTELVSNIDELVNAWKSTGLTLQLCKSFYEITVLFTEARTNFVEETTVYISNRLNLDIIQSKTTHGKFKNFIEEIFSKTSTVACKLFTKKAGTYITM